MLKKLLLLCLLLLVVAGCALAYAFYNANALIARMQPELERQASEALGTPVSLGMLDLKLFPNTAIAIQKVQLGEGQDKTLNLGAVELDIELRPLFSKQLEIVELSVKKPEIIMVKTKEGMAVSGLARKTTAPEKEPAKEAPPAGTGGGGELRLNLRKLSIEDARLVIDDRVTNKRTEITSSFSAAMNLQGKEFTVTEVAAKVKGFDDITVNADIDQFRYNLETGKFETEKVALKTPAGDFDISASGVTKDGSLVSRVKSGAVNLAKIAEIASRFSPAVAALQLNGNTTLDIEISKKGDKLDVNGKAPLSQVSLISGNYTISELNSRNLTFSATGNSQNIDADDLNLKLNQKPVTVAVKVNKTGQRVSIPDLKVTGFAGTLTAPSELELVTPLKFSSRFEASGFNLEELVSTFAANAPRLKGTLQSLRGRISGVTGADMLRSLNGQFDVKLADGLLEGQNIAGSVLKSINNLPGVNGSLYETVPPEGTTTVNENATVIKLLNGNFSLGDFALSTKDLLVQSDIFDLQSEGAIGLDSVVDLKASILFNKRFSGMLAARTKELQRVLDKDGRLIVPLTLKGAAPKIVVVPDLRKLLEIGARGVARDEAGKLIDRALGDKAGGAGKEIIDMFGF